MSYNIDGFNERTTFINKARNMNKLEKNRPINSDNSFAKMRTEERRGLVQTSHSSEVIKQLEETRGTRDNFVVQSSHISNFNRPVNQNNPVSRAMANNKFKRPN